MDNGANPDEEDLVVYIDSMHSVDIYRSLAFISNHGLTSLGPSGFHQFVHVKIPHGQIKMSSQ